MKSTLLGIIFILSSAAPGSPYQDGDLIFQESRSSQSKAIQEATGSRWSHVGILFRDNEQWFVAEAVQPVGLTSLSHFVSRGLNHDYQIYRVSNLTDAQRFELRASVQKFMGRNYDIYFEWTDDLIYCSEFVFKTFLSATGQEIGVIQRFRDQRLDGPYVKELIRRRLEDTGRILNLDEPIITPISQMLDPKLELIESSK